MKCTKIEMKKTLLDIDFRKPYYEEAIISRPPIKYAKDGEALPDCDVTCKRVYYEIIKVKKYGRGGSSESVLVNYDDLEFFNSLLNLQKRRVENMIQLAENKAIEKTRNEVTSDMEIYMIERFNKIPWYKRIFKIKI